MNKMEDLINMTKLNELLNKKEEVEEKKTSKVVTISRMILMMISSRTMMMRKRRQSLRTKRKQPKIKTKGMGLQRGAALFLCNRKRSVGMRTSW